MGEDFPEWKGSCFYQGFVKGEELSLWYLAGCTSMKNKSQQDKRSL